MFSARRGSMSERPIGHDSLLDIPRDFYLMTTRGALHFHHHNVDELFYLSASCPNWEAHINHFGRTQNS